MGLRDYEFDVAPELVAAVVRGRPGPLMDAALAHIGNIAEAAREAERREQNERDRAMVEGVEESIAASLEEVSSNVANGVGRDGVFSSNRVGGSIGGSVNRLGTNSAQNLGPGGKIGRIPIGKSGLFGRGVTAHEVAQSMALGGAARVSTDTSQAGERLDRARNTESVWRQKHNLYQEQYGDADPRTEAAAEAADRSTADRKRAEVTYTRLVLRDSRITPNPEGESGAGPLSAAARWHLDWFLGSLGGLGVLEETSSSNAARRVSIMNAVDPSPDRDESFASTELIQFWQDKLIDPTFGS